MIVRVVMNNGTITYDSEDVERVEVMSEHHRLLVQTNHTTIDAIVDAYDIVKLQCYLKGD